jgi:short-subunit dehydrogenase
MKYALITGASGGIGLELARLFAGDGTSLILVARREAQLKATAAELLSLHPSIEVKTIALDLSVPGAGTALYRQVQSLGPDIEFLVNNAGFGSSGRFSDLRLEAELQMIDLNVRSLLELTHLLLPHMLARGRGRILNVGSTAGFQPGPYMATYYASKAFVNSFSEALHEELLGTGVTCTVLTPGATATEFAKNAGASDSALFQSGLVASPAKVASMGYRGMQRGRAIIVTGLLNKLMVQALRITPRQWVRKIAARMNQKYS